MFNLDMRPIYLPPLPPNRCTEPLSTYGPIRKYRVPSTIARFKSITGGDRKAISKPLQSLPPLGPIPPILKDSETRLIGWVPITSPPTPPFVHQPSGKEPQESSMWCEKYKELYVGSRVFYKQFEYWCLNKWKYTPCCIYGGSGCGKSALVRECLNNLGLCTLELDICSFPPDQSDQLLRSALQCAGFSKKIVVIRDISDTRISRVLSVYFNKLNSQANHVIPLVLITGSHRQFLNYRQKCYGIQVTQKPTLQALRQLAKSVLALEDVSNVPVADLADNCQGNPGRLLCNLQLSTLMNSGTFQSEPRSISLSDDMRKITRAVLSVEMSLSDVVSLLDTHSSRLQRFIYANYLESLASADDSLESAVQVSEMLSLVEVLPRAHSSIHIGLVLQQTNWVSRYSNLLKIPEQPYRYGLIKEKALRTSALISGMNPDGILDVISHTRDPLRYLGSQSRYLFSRNYGEFPYVHREDSSDRPDCTPQKQQLLLWRN
jgi:hypothetical protein